MDSVSRTNRVVVLTEGSTDKWIIERSLKLLFPHLADFFRFMDFEGVRVSGGAPALVASVKAFIGTGVTNRIIAMFDNDTAASDVLRSLDLSRLPRNIKVLQFPRLPLAYAYPALGPSGAVEKMDINGLACSVEIYLGRSVLSPNGELSPIQWKGFNEGMRRYQGELVGKRRAQDAFEAQLRRCEAPALARSGTRLDRNALDTQSPSRRIQW